MPLLHEHQPPSFTSSKPYALSGAIVINGKDRVMMDGALIIQGNKIIDALDTAGISQRYQGITQIDCSEFVLAPGYINAHTHATMGFFRGLGLDEQVDDQSVSMIESFLIPAEKSLTAELIGPLAYSYLMDALRSGVTTMVDHYYWAAGVGEALDLIGMRGVIGETVADLGGAFPGVEPWHRWKDVIANWPFSNRILPAVAPHAADTVSRPLLTELAQFAKQHGLSLHMHLSQTSGERSRVMAREGLSPTAYASACGALSERTLAVHLVSVDTKDIALLRSTGVTGVVCPASQILYENLAPIDKLWPHLPMAIATDCAASNDVADVHNEARWCGLLLRNAGVRADVDAASMLAAITSVPAKALGLGDQLGQLEPGFQADVLFYQRDVTNSPWHKPHNNLLYSTQSRHLKHVMVAGEWVLWDHEPTRVSEPSLYDAYMESLQRLSAYTNKRHPKK